MRANRIVRYPGCYVLQVGSRWVMITGAGIMVVMGLLGKFAAVFVSIPEPVVGGLFIVLFGDKLIILCRYSLNQIYTQPNRLHQTEDKGVSRYSVAISSRVE